MESPLDFSNSTNLDEPFEALAKLQLPEPQNSEVITQITLMPTSM
jgi:hypothetical protein